MSEEQRAAQHSDHCSPCPTCLAVDVAAARDAERWAERRGCIGVLTIMAEELEREDSPVLAGILRLAAVKMADR